ncbi:MAG: hypothetical protein ACM3XZ_09370 [Betaproteobacteria bacterium]
MTPRQSRQVVGAFVASLGAITLATEACLRVQAPLWAAAPALALAGVMAFAGMLLVMRATDARRIRVWRAGWPRQRYLCPAEQTARGEYRSGRQSVEAVC